MPAKRTTDWKQVLAQLTAPPPGAQVTAGNEKKPLGAGKTILASGTKQSKGNEGVFKAIKSREDLLRVLEANRKMYQTLRQNKKGKRMGRDQLKGLFGGGP